MRSSPTPTSPLQFKIVLPPPKGWLYYRKPIYQASSSWNNKGVDILVFAILEFIGPHPLADTQPLFVTTQTRERAEFRSFSFHLFLSE
mmetsp:Transcript_1424/g.3529  ORF Transcript_1424/g.3529 Transcript_1424/m.3529 type:complete len:88 (+) Transcript_1424:191-454(+)